MADSRDVKVVISYSTEFDGKEYEAGKSATFAPEVARILVGRGYAQYDSTKDAEKAQPAPADTKGGAK